MAYKPTVGLIADAFSSGFRQRQQQDQQQAQFDLELSQKERQQGLLNFWKQKDFEAEQSYRKSLIENQRIDNERQGKVADAQIENYKIDNENQALRTKEMERHNKAIEYQNSLKKETGSSFKGFGDYFSKRGGLLGTKALTDEYDDKGKRTGNLVETSLLPSEIKSNKRQLEGLAVSKLPPNAQNFYAQNFLGKKASKLAFFKYVQDAYNNGMLSDTDANALLDINELRNDWGAIPQGERVRITNPKNK